MSTAAALRRPAHRRRALAAARGTDRDPGTARDVMTDCSLPADDASEDRWRGPALRFVRHYVMMIIAARTQTLSAGRDGCFHVGARDAPAQERVHRRRGTSPKAGTTTTGSRHPARRRWQRRGGLLQARVTLHLRDAVLQDGCRCAREVPAGARARCRPGRPSRRSEPGRVAAGFDISVESVRRWVRQADAGDASWTARPAASRTSWCSCAARSAGWRWRTRSCAAPRPRSRRGLAPEMSYPRP
jgi:hypothetical protein